MKVLSYLLIILGGIPTIVFGLFPIIYLYPNKGLGEGINWGWVLFEDVNRLYWQIGIIVLVIGLILLYIEKKE